MSSARVGEAAITAPHRGATRHWLYQRLSALALVPLGAWFLVALLSRPDLGYASIRAWLADPWQATLLLLFAACYLWHSLLGVEVVVEDYASPRLCGVTLRILRAVHAVAAGAVVYAVWRLASGGAG